MNRTLATAVPPWRRVLRSAVLAYVVLMIWGLLFTDAVIFVPPAPSYREGPGVYRIALPNGERVGVLAVTNAAPAPRTILYVHGNAEDLGHVRFLLEDYRAHGFDVYGVDFRGYGISDGRPGARRALEDVEAAYDHLVRERGLAPERIIVHGRSVGAAMAIHLAAHRPVGGLIVESGFVTAFRVRTVIPIVPFDKLRNNRWIRDVRAPVLFIHGEADRIIPPRHGKQLYDLAPGPKSAWWVPGAGHNDLYEVAGAAYWTQIAAFVQSLPAVVSPAGNPVLPGADPHALVAEGRVWVYPTHRQGGFNFFAFSSRDLRTWERHGPVLDFADVAWIRDDGRERHGPWAPGVVERGGRYFFYYSVGPQTAEHPSRIGVAVGASPGGPFRDSGKCLLSGGRGFEAIDPMVFTDPADGNAYLYAGGGNGSKLRVFALNPDMVSLRAEIPVETPRQFTEGAFMHHHAGMYHLTYSHGSWTDASYSVHYATASTATGPWTYRGVLLQSDARHKGPGHHSFIRHPATGAWFIVYHRWNRREGPGPYSGQREVAIERVTHGADGLLRPVTMTDEGPPPGAWPPL